MNHVPDDRTKVGIHQLFTLADVEMIDQILLDQLKIRQAILACAPDSTKSTIHDSHIDIYPALTAGTCGASTATAYLPFWK